MLLEPCPWNCSCSNYLSEDKYPRMDFTTHLVTVVCALIIFTDTQVHVWHIDFSCAGQKYHYYIRQCTLFTMLSKNNDTIPPLWLWLYSALMSTRSVNSMFPTHGLSSSSMNPVLFSVALVQSCKICIDSSNRHTLIASGITRNSFMNFPLYLINEFPI